MTSSPGPTHTSTVRFPWSDIAVLFLFPIFTHPHFDLFLVLLTLTPCLFSLALPCMTTPPPSWGEKGSKNSWGDVVMELCVYLGALVL